MREAHQSDETGRVQARRAPAPASAARQEQVGAALLGLQRRAGNAVVVRALQTKLTVGGAGDRFEREADEVADQVVPSLRAAMSHPQPGDGVRRRPEDIPSGRIQAIALGPVRHELGSRSPARTGRVQRNGDGLDTFLEKLKETSDLTSLRGQVTEWKGEDVERAARHFGVPRFQDIVFALGHELLGKTTASEMCALDPKNPLAVPVGSLAQRVDIAKRWKVSAGDFATHLAVVAPTEGGTPTGALMKAAREYGVAFPARFEAVLGHGSFSTDGVKPEVELVSQPERDQVWQDKRLMAKAKGLLNTNDYLDLLPMLRVFTPPTGATIAGAQPGWDKHISSDQVDIYITQHLSHYVGKLVGRKAQGEISVVGDEDWELAFRRQWPTLDPMLVKPNAFVDVDQPKRQIWIHKDRGDSGTAIHEGMHKYASDNIRNIMRVKFPGRLPISQLDEGLTEYFTRLVTSKLGITRTSYPNPLKFATSIIGVISEATAAKAYYDGDLDLLVNTYLTKTARSTAQWELFAKALEEENWTVATRVWNTGA
jgi:hypothetical protein